MSLSREHWEHCIDNFILDLVKQDNREYWSSLTTSQLNTFQTSPSSQVRLNSNTSIYWLILTHTLAMEALIFTSLIDFGFGKFQEEMLLGLYSSIINYPILLHCHSSVIPYCTVQYGNTVNFKVLDCSQVGVTCGDTLTLFNARFDLIVLFPPSLSKQLVD